MESLPGVYAIKNQFCIFAQSIVACYGVANFSCGEKLLAVATHSWISSFGSMNGAEHICKRREMSFFANH